MQTQEAVQQPKNIELTYRQGEAWDALHDESKTEIVYGGAAGGGKSWLGCFWVLQNVWQYPGTRWLIGRAKLKTLKETTLATLFDLLSSLGYPSKEYKYREQAGKIIFSNGSEIVLKDLFAYPSDPNFDSLGSLEISGAFIDEISEITEKAWYMVKSRIRYKLENRSPQREGVKPWKFSATMLGTCNPSKGWVYASFFKPWKEQELPIHRAFIQALPPGQPTLAPRLHRQLEKPPPCHP